ncbi:MAG TPA: DUF2652 domain-containing protein [Roseiflexaceae bacterium]|nr:DUF2652 domain-containing protein [Roseiflexaceae bacterium]
MAGRQAALVFADISGYTRFTRMHATSLLHAEAIISELMDAVITAAEPPLRVGQLEGDAVLLVGELSEGEAEDAARRVVRQIGTIFSSFTLRERGLIACDAGCVCDACTKIGELRLKAVLHAGVFQVRRIRDVTDLAGEDVQRLRALIKAPVPWREYILMTRAFYELSGGFEKRTPDLHLADLGGPLMIYLPPPVDTRPPALPGGGAALAARLNRHAFARMLGRVPRVPFTNLADGPIDPIRYLLEGTRSGLNLLRRWSRRHRPVAEVRPVVLALVEVGGAETSHPEPLLTALLQMVVAAVRPPLVLNKLAGGVVLCYALAEEDCTAVVRAVMVQVQQWRSAFLVGAAAPGARGDSLAAREGLSGLHLRVLLHAGEAVLKRVFQFDEIAGQDVILIHRLLQTSLSHHDYLLITEPVYRRLSPAERHGLEFHVEQPDGFDPVPIWVRPLADSTPPSRAAPADLVQ